MCVSMYEIRISNFMSHSIFLWLFFFFEIPTPGELLTYKTKDDNKRTARDTIIIQVNSTQQTYPSHILDLILINEEISNQHHKQQQLFSFIYCPTSTKINPPQIQNRKIASSTFTIHQT